MINNLFEYWADHVSKGSGAKSPQILKPNLVQLFAITEYIFQIFLQALPITYNLHELISVITM